MIFSRGSKGNIGKKKANASVITISKKCFWIFQNVCVYLDEVGEFGHRQTVKT